MTFIYKQSGVFSKMDVSTLLTSTKYKLRFHLISQVIVQAFKFASNEYRYFPLRLQINLCNLYTKDMVGFGYSGQCRNFVGCPKEEVLLRLILWKVLFIQMFLQEKLYQICNFVPDVSKLPPLIPNGRL